MPVTDNWVWDSCPACEATMVHPFVALSRRDNKTHVCPDCGLREAFEDWREMERKLIELENK